ncbi:MAG: putative beta-ketoadipyl CoA thiolase with thiolase-like domain, phenylacetic acid metabolism [Frankiales bacterium]|nr:putative beta-ketoadipyl CoA thiolase with thiolase-like domain, phenylacetic acid metabolism [Frankiales bacterium]
MREAWIIDGLRTPRGRGKATGALHHIHPQELLAQVLNGLVERTGIDPAEVEDVLVGNAEFNGDHGASIGRLAVLHAGWPITVPGVTLNRYCGSGQQAVTFGAMGIRSGEQDLVVAGGIESMSRWGASGGTVEPTMLGLNPALGERYPMVPQGISGDAIATLEGFSRSDVDAFAVTSQDKAAKALSDGRFDRSLIAVKNADGSIALDKEEFPRPGTTLESLAGLKPAFAGMGAATVEGYPQTFDEMVLARYPQLSSVDHVHTGGNSSGVVDGAAALVLASSDYAKAHGLAPRARIRATAVAGADPVLMLTAPTPAVERVLAKAGLSVGDIDLWEINEAFAAIPMKTMRDLSIDPDKVNVNGGAIALGHPIGASGAMLIQTVVDELERRDLRTGLVVMCTGGGMGTATIVERF